MKRDLSPRMLTPDMLTTPHGIPVMHDGHGVAGNGAANPLTPRFFFNVLRRWWKLSTVIGVFLATAAGLIAYFTHMPVYEAKTWLRMRDTYVLPNEQRRDIGAFINTQRELIRSPPVIAEALAKPGISSLPIFDGVEDPITWLSGRIVANSVGGSELFVIMLQSKYKDSVAKVVNAVRDAYLANLGNDTMKQNDLTLVALEQERQRRYSEIENDRNRLRLLASELDGSGNRSTVVLDEQQIRTVSVLEELQKQLTLLEVELSFGQAELSAVERTLKDPSEIKIEEQAISQAVDTHPETVQLLAELEKAQEGLNALRKTINKDSTRLGATLQKREEYVAELEAKLEAKRKELLPTVREQLLEVAVKKQQEILQGRRLTIEQKETMCNVLRAKIKKAREESQQTGQNSLAKQFLEEDLLRKQNVYQKIVDRIETIRTESRALSPVTVLLDAPEPIEPVGRGPVTQGVMFAALAFLLPFSGFFLWELKSRRIGDLDDFREATNMRVVGEISTLPVRSKFLPAANRKFEESLTRFEESIDYLRTSILIARHQRSMQSLVVCSAASREGKSTVAAHLASSLARGIGGRVLLVDADMRRPHLHRLLDQDPDNGLVDYLAGRSEFADVIRPTWVERLDFVASGILDTPVGVLLASDRFERFLRLAEKQYEFIVIDVPPILPVSEGLVIAKASDGAIFCALRDVSTATNVHRACEKLRSAGVHIVGAVFNGVPAREYGASGYYYYRIPQATSAPENVQA